MKVRVTDHAILRYLERFGGLQIERLREDMAARIEAVRDPSTPYVHIDGLSFVVREDHGMAVVTTVMTNKGPRKPRKRRKGARK